MRLFTRTAGRRSDLLGLWLALAAVPVAALPHAWEQPPWVIAILLGAWLLRATIHGLRRQLPALWLLTVMVVAGGALTVAEFGTVFGQQAGTALLLVMVALKLLEIRSRRDIVVTLYLAYFVVVTTYFFNQSFVIAAYSLFSAWLITAALIQVHAARVLPPQRLASSAAAMIVHALPIMLILFVVFPRIPGPLWGNPEPDPTVAQSGLSERLEPGGIAALLENEATALRVRFHEPAPAPSQQYWRALVMTDFDGSAWTVDRHRPEIPVPAAAAGDIAYTATLEPTGSRYVPVLESPIELPEIMQLRDNFQVFYPKRIDTRIQYSASARLEPTAVEPLPSMERSRALRLPADSAPRARVLAEGWRVDHGTDDRAIISEALQLFGADPFRYTLQPPRLQGDRTDAFLFQTRAGYCEHYAAALAVLMRAAGIPARVITGYQGGQWMDTGNYLRLRYADAHAWTELWLEDSGWVRVDPTAAIAPERIEAGLGGLFADDADAPAFLRRSGLPWTVQWRLRLADWHDLATFRWESLVLAFDPDRQRELFARVGLDATDWRSVLLALVVAMGGLGLVAALAAWVRRPKAVRDAPQRALDHLSRRLSRHGLVRRSDESAERFTQRAAGRFPTLAESLHRFAEAYNRLRYADLAAHERAACMRQLDRSLAEAKPRSRTRRA